MAITKTEIITNIEEDISTYETKISDLMATGSMSSENDILLIKNYSRTLCLLNDTKTYITNL